MKDLVDKLKMILLKKEGNSNRKVAKMCNSNRKTVAKYWNEHVKNKEKLQVDNAS